MLTFWDYLGIVFIGIPTFVVCSMCVGSVVTDITSKREGEESAIKTFFIGAFVLIVIVLMFFSN